MKLATISGIFQENVQQFCCTGISELSNRMIRTSRASPLPSYYKSAEPLHLCISACWFAVCRPYSVSAGRPNVGYRDDVVVVDAGAGNDIAAPVNAFGRSDVGNFVGCFVGAPI